MHSSIRLRVPMVGDHSLGSDIVGNLLKTSPAASSSPYSKRLQTMANAFLQGVLGALQATLSVLLVLCYGAAGTKYLSFLSEDTINSVTKLGTSVLLPCLLFTEMGKEAKPEQLKEFWILPVFNVALTLIALAYSYIGIKLFKMPRWIAPAAAFPNMLSLPLLLIESLSSSGVLDNLLMDKKDTVDEALERAKIYFLVNVRMPNILLRIKGLTIGNIGLIRQHRMQCVQSVGVLGLISTFAGPLRSRAISSESRGR